MASSALPALPGNCLGGFSSWLFSSLRTLSLYVHTMAYTQNTRYTFLIFFRPCESPGQQGSYSSCAFSPNTKKKEGFIREFRWPSSNTHRSNRLLWDMKGKEDKVDGQTPFVDDPQIGLRYASNATTVARIRVCCHSSCVRVCVCGRERCF